LSLACQGKCTLNVYFLFLSAFFVLENALISYPIKEAQERFFVRQLLLLDIGIPSQAPIFRIRVHFLNPHFLCEGIEGFF
jgi:hypothetical protein